MRIGILGGSFDPIHNGHLNMALSAYKELKLDKIWIMPSGHSPNKNELSMTSAEHRYNMCKILSNDYDFIVASDYEINKSTTSYTYQTMQELTNLYPNDVFYFIMGADSIDYFDKWYHPEIIASLCTILVIVREGFTPQNTMNKISELKEIYKCNIELVSSEQYDISSTKIRKAIKNNIDVSMHLNDGVYKYILQHNLY